MKNSKWFGRIMFLIIFVAMVPLTALASPLATPGQPGEVDAALWQTLPTLTPTPTPTKPPCCTMHVDDIQMSYLQKNKVIYDVFADITIKDQDGDPMDGATVSAQWTRPNGSLVDQQEVTGATGVASFATCFQAGTYKICVTDVAKTCWIYDPSQNVKTCETLTVP